MMANTAVPAAGLGSSAVAVRMRWRRKSPRPPRRVYSLPPDVLAWARVVDVSRLSDHTVKAAEDYLRMYERMNVLARSEVGRRLVSVIETQVAPPPPLDGMPSDIMATVLAVRRRQLGTGEWPGWTDWPGVSDWPNWAAWPGWDRSAPRQ